MFQATADEADARQQGIDAGFIADWMTKEEAVACLYAQYIFIGFDAKYSPNAVGNLLKHYCPYEFYVQFVNFYIHIVRKNGIFFDEKTFDEDLINPIMDIPGSGREMRSKGYKKHWIPQFKEPFITQWHNCYLE